MAKKAGRIPSENPRKEYVMIMLTPLEKALWQNAADRGFEGNVSRMARAAVARMVGTQPQAVQTAPETQER